VWRLFDKPGVAADGINVGVQWGIFFALCAAGLLAYAGSRMRASARPEPPYVERRIARAVEEAPRPAPGTTVTRPLPPEQSAPPRARPRRPPGPDDQLTIPLGDEPG
jgi:hypothetical protein